MLRGGPQASAQDNKQQQQQQQKQKKRLSFKDPEVEGPLRNYLYAGCKSKTLVKTTKATNSSKTSASVEDLTLEDQALKIAQNVGSAFSDLSITDNEQVDFPGLESIPTDIESQKETEILDSSPTEFVSYQRSCQLRSFKISAEDQKFLDALVPPLLDETMRGPSVESTDPNSTKNCIPAEPSLYEGRPSSSAQHQIQLLRYQLEQQNQQTQMALHQVQLLQDQMDAESAARRKAQEQNNQLMQQNKELLNHMEKLFQQIEELERQIMALEHEKRGRRVISSPENQITSVRQPTSYAVSRKPNSEQVVSEKPTLQNRTQYAAAKKSQLTSTKQLATTSKPSTQNSSTTLGTRKTPSISSKPFVVQNKSKDPGTKEKEALRIGDTSPPVQSGTVSPFTSTWKLRSADTTTQSNTDKSGSAVRSRAGSFSSYTKKPQESDTAKSTLFSSSTNNSLSSTNITSKKYSSSTSDLYNSPFQRKSSLTIEEPSTSVKSAVSNLSLSTTSKLPRYQPYTGWQRRTSLTGESEQVSAVSKDSYKSPTKPSLFNR